MRRQADAAKVALDIAQTAYDKTVLGYHNGLFPFTDVLSAQTALAQARSAYTQALYDAGAAEATLNALIAPTTTTGKVNR
jgi:outer membrane protein TolC